MTAPTPSYDTVRVRRAALAALIDRAGRAFRALDMAAWAGVAEGLAARVANDRFRVMVLGEFKRGKSTLINALLGADVLPTAVGPCTAVINEVKWGDRPRAVLHFRRPPPADAAALPPAARRHLDRHRGGEVPPPEAAIADLREFVAIPDPAADPAASVAASPYDRAELYWPLPLCRNGVEVIDSPGLNEHHTRTKTTRDYLASVDAVVFVTSVHALASESELAVIDHDLRPSGHDRLFFVCNRFDELRKREDRDKVTAYAYAQLAGRTRFGREGVHFVSAADALDGRVDGDAGKVSRSGIKPLEDALERFLVEDRGRVKLAQPAGHLSSGLRAALAEVIPARRRLLDEDAAVLQRRLDEARPLLDQAVGLRDAAVRRVDAARRRVREAVRREAEGFFGDLSQDVPAWSRRLATASRVSGLDPTRWQGQADRVARDMAEGLASAVEASLARWERSQLRPLIEQQMAELEESLRQSLEPFPAHLDGVRARLAGGWPPARTAAPAGDPVLANIGGLLVGGGLILVSAANVGTGAAGAGLAGAGVGGSATAVGAHVVAQLLSAADPVVLGTTAAGLLAMMSHRLGEALTDKAKARVAEGVAAQLRAEARQRAAAIADEVHRHTDRLAAAVADGLEAELRQVREQVDAVLREKARGEAAVARQRKALAAQEAELRAVADELNDLLLALAGGADHPPVGGSGRSGWPPTGGRRRHGGTRWEPGRLAGHEHRGRGGRQHRPPGGRQGDRPEHVPAELHQRHLAAQDGRRDQQERPVARQPRRGRPGRPQAPGVEQAPESQRHERREEHRRRPAVRVEPVGPRGRHLGPAARNRATTSATPARNSGRANSSPTRTARNAPPTPKMSRPMAGVTMNASGRRGGRASTPGWGGSVAGARARTCPRSG